ncbi:uncharacterized protein LOC127851555 [Dreissena polymorpha]|nr:uncharacterized protein LOC127851555 [Dreissena polymorpha]
MCSDSELIYLIDQKYGSKNGSCSTIENNCFMSGSGCCSQTGSDCLKDYAQSHAYDLHRACSGKSNCEIQAAGNLNCYGNPEWSTYGKISFSCTRASDVVHFCDHAIVEKESAHIIFDKQEFSSNNHSFCSCNVASSENLIVTYVDVRLERFHTTKSTTNCSSSRLDSFPQIHTPIVCTSTLDDYANFVYKRTVNTTIRNVRLELNDLFKLDAFDSPVYVWVLVTARNNANVNVSCASLMTTPKITTTTTKTTTTATQTTMNTTEYSTQIPSSTTDTMTTTKTTTTATQTTMKTTEYSTQISNSTTGMTTLESPKPNESTPGFTVVTTSIPSQHSVPSTTENSTDTNDSGTPNTVVIGGAVAAGLVVLVISIALVCIIRLKRRGQRPKTIPEIPKKDTDTDDYAVIPCDINSLYDNNVNSKNKVAEEKDSGNTRIPGVPLRNEDKFQTKPILKVLHSDDNYIEFIKASSSKDQYQLPNNTQCKNMKLVDEQRPVSNLEDQKQKVDILFSDDLEYYIEPVSDFNTPKPCIQMTSLPLQN